MKSFRSGREVIAEVEQVLAKKRGRGSPLEKALKILRDGRHYLWAGIYLLVGDHVVCAAFQGPVPAPHRLAFGALDPRAAVPVSTRVLPDSADPAYTMRLRESKSEAIVPLKIAGRVLGVLDVESERANAFAAQERVLLKHVAARLALFLSGRGKYIVQKARQTTAAASQSGGVTTTLRAAAGEKTQG